MFVWQSWLGLAVAVAIALAAAIVVVAIVSLVMRFVARSNPSFFAATLRPRRRLRVVMFVVGVWIAVSLTLPEDTGLGGLINHTLLIALILTGAWFVLAVVRGFIDRVLLRYPTDVVDNRVARRVHTQMLVIRRLVTAVIVIVAVGGILLTFDGAQAIGTSLLASAGLVSVIAGIAAQSALGNVFAGMQLAFSDAIRVDDVVVVSDGEFGRIEEITLAYVVVRIWDERRMVLPSTYFTSTPFQNWTRTGSQLMGAVEFDLDWRVNPAHLREALTSMLTRTDLWDGRTANLQVTAAVGGFVHIRIVISASDAGRLWDLRCWVREQVIIWLQEKAPSSLPRNRVLMVEPDARQRSKSKIADDDSGLFSGSPEAEQRGQEFTNSIPVVRSAIPIIRDEGDPAPR